MTEALEHGCRANVSVHERRSKTFPKVVAYRQAWGEARYVLAASLLKLGKSDESLKVLQETTALGYRDKNALSTNPEWQALRNREGFKKLLD